MYDSVDYNSLKFEDVGPTNDVSLYEYKDSEELFNTIKYSKIKFSEVKKKQNEILNKLSNIKTGRKTKEQKEVIRNLENFSREEAINFFRDYTELLYDAKYNAKKMKLREKDLKY